jgi:hypothetical protein
MPGRWCCRPALPTRPGFLCSAAPPASHVASDNGRKSPLPKSAQQGNQGTRSLIPPGLCNTVLEVNALMGRVAWCPPAIDQERERASGTARRQRPRRGSGARPGAGLLPRPAPGPTRRPARRQGAGGGAGLAAAPLHPPARRHPGVRACDRPPRLGAHELVFMADLAVELRSRASACWRRLPGSAGGAAAPAAGSPPGP